MELADSHKLEFPADRAARLHLVSGSELKRRIRAGLFFTAETCDDDRAADWELDTVYRQRAEFDPVHRLLGSRQTGCTQISASARGPMTVAAPSTSQVSVSSQAFDCTRSTVPGTDLQPVQELKELAVAFENAGHPNRLPRLGFAQRELTAAAPAGRGVRAQAVAVRAGTLLAQHGDQPLFEIVGDGVLQPLRPLRGSCTSRIRRPGPACAPAGDGAAGCGWRCGVLPRSG